VRTSAVIFDFDGVLVDSERTHLAAIRAAGSVLDLSVSDERYFGQFVAWSDAEIFRGMAADGGRELSPADLKRLLEAKWSAFDRLVHEGKVERFPGSFELVRACAQRCPVGLCTAASRRTIDSLLGPTGLLASFRAIVTADCVTRTKPDPEPYVRAAALLSTPPECCVAIEDTPGGTASARDAGCKVVAVCHTLPRAKHTRATLVVDRIADVDADALLALAEETVR
jgi:beta-phosphoglucomutase